MTDVIDVWEAKQEVLNWLRNSDIFTTTERGVTTTADTGTFASDSTHVIAVTNIKNIRSIVVGGTTLKYGEDYQVNFDFDDTTIKTKITFTAAQTGAFTITYDFGSDVIWPDFPRPDLSIDSFPRIGFDLLDITTEFGGLGNVFLSSATIQLIIYSTNNKQLDTLSTTVRTKIIEKLGTTIDGSDPFFYFPKYVSPALIGPIIKSPKEMGKDKVMQKNIDILGRWKYEIN